MPLRVLAVRVGSGKDDTTELELAMLEMERVEEGTVSEVMMPVVTSEALLRALEAVISGVLPLAPALEVEPEDTSGEDETPKSGDAVVELEAAGAGSEVVEVVDEAAVPIGAVAAVSEDAAMP